MVKFSRKWKHKNEGNCFLKFRFSKEATKFENNVRLTGEIVLNFCGLKSKRVVKTFNWKKPFSYGKISKITRKKLHKSK